MSETGWSLTEARSLSVKAARGAGLSWGLAEEAGFAVQWLHERGGGGVAALAAYLDAIRDEATCPIRIGASLSDGALAIDQINQPIAQPLLLVPFVAVAEPNYVHRIVWENCICTAAQTGLKIEGKPLCHQSTLTFSRGEINTEAQCYSRVSADGETAMKRLAVHAHKTYAPATEASRLAGAGAGLSDND